MLRHFKSQFTSNKNFDPCNYETIRLAISSHLTQEQHLMLLQAITKEEIGTTMFSLAQNKSLGPGGYPAEFFKHSWDTIEEDITNIILDFFRMGKLLREVGNSIIAPIPKVANPTSLADVRPISCCNTAYKCITKLLANSIALCLPSLIGREQSAFIPGRRIADNILLVHELVHAY